MEDMGFLNQLYTMHSLKRNLQLKRAELMEIQQRKLISLVKHAYKNISYYRRLFDYAGLKPEDIKEAADLRYIPITDKATMRKLPIREKVAQNINMDDCMKVFTSGSTGIPAHLFFTREDFTLLDMVYMRSFLENGLKFRYKRAFILDPHSFETKKCWYHGIGLGRYINISCFLQPEEQIRILDEYRPDFIHGYPSSIVLISKLIIEKGYKCPRPLMVSTAAELLDIKNRELINSAFGVNLYDRYAARECGNIAWECDVHNGYHINADTIVAEFIKDGRPAKPGERGDIVITNLHSYAMPFIRYKIGDVGKPSERMCLCGIELPLMEIIEGRDEDFLLLKSGKMVSPMMVTGILDHIPGIRQFRIVQENVERVVATIARGEGFTPDTVTEVERGLKDTLGKDITIRCEVVDNISRDVSGKVRAVISKVS
jgi:phenylacetate-CoA ligase